MTMIARCCLIHAILIASLTVAHADKKLAPAGSKGVPFSLPKTMLNVDLTVTKTVKKNGQFCQFNDLFLGAARPCGPQPDPETTVKSFAVTPVGVPDPNHTYFVPFSEKGGWAIDTSGAVELTERGLLTSVDSGRVNRRFEVILSVLQAAAGISKTVLFAPPPPVATESPKTLSTQDEREFIHEFLKDDWTLVWNFHKLVSANPGRAAALVELWKKSDPALLAARQAYAGIEKLNVAYERLLGGEGAVGAATLVVEVRRETDDRRKRYFAGTSDSATWSPTFEVDPVAGDVPLIKISACGAKAADGTHVIANPDPGDVKCDDASKSISLTLKKTAVAADIGKLEGCVKEGIMTGIPFTLPAEAAATLSGLPDPAAGFKLQIAQWGGQSCLPVTGGSFTTSVTYWESTGAIKTAKFTSSSSINKDNIAALGGIAGDLVKADMDARQKAADDAKNKDLTDLQAERERLEEKVKIQAACAALKITCTF